MQGSISSAAGGGGRSRVLPFATSPRPIGPVGFWSCRRTAASRVASEKVIVASLEHVTSRFFGGAAAVAVASGVGAGGGGGGAGADAVWAAGVGGSSHAAVSASARSR